jgi:hypothetical protein
MSHETIAAVTAAAVFAAGGHVEAPQPHQEQTHVSAEQSLGATGMQGAVRPEAEPNDGFTKPNERVTVKDGIKTTEVTLSDMRTDALQFSASPEAHVPPTGEQGNTFDFAVKKLVDAGNGDIKLSYQGVTSDEARATHGEKSMAGFGRVDEQNTKLGNTMAAAEQLADTPAASKVAGYEIPSTIEPTNEIIRPDLATSIKKIAADHNTTPHAFVNDLKNSPNSLPQDARDALSVLPGDRRVDIKITGSQPVPTEVQPPAPLTKIDVTKTKYSPENVRGKIEQQAEQPTLTQNDRDPWAEIPAGYSGMRPTTKLATQGMSGKAAPQYRPPVASSHKQPRAFSGNNQKTHKPRDRGGSLGRPRN